jgi:hypothetical protein
MQRTFSLTGRICRDSPGVFLLLLGPRIMDGGTAPRPEGADDPVPYGRTLRNPPGGYRGMPVRYCMMRSMMTGFFGRLI